MSETAGEYYLARAEDLGIRSVPNILDGVPARMPTLYNASPKLTADWFSQRMKGVSDFALDGLPGVYEALGEGDELTTKQWHQIRSLLPYKARSAGSYISTKLVPYLFDRMPSHCQITHEAIRRSEVPKMLLGRAAYTEYEPRDKAQESAQVFLLTRILTAEGRICPAAYFTLVWGEHRKIFRGGDRPGHSFREYLTPRYLGAKVLASELALLPPGDFRDPLERA